jgi:hypothetical protein
MSTILSNITKSNNSLITFLESPVVKYSILIIVTILIIVIDKIDINYLEIFENDMFKLIYSLIIVYTACFDPIYAIVLTTFIIIAIQELHTRKATIGITLELQNDTINNNRINNSINNNKLNDNDNNNIDFVESKITKDDDDENTQSVMYENNKSPSDTTLTNIKDAHAIINKQTMQKHPEENDSLIVNYDYYEDPAFKTLTNNLQEKNRLNKNKFLVNEDDLLKAQTNKQPSMPLSSAEIKLCDIQGYDHLYTNNDKF